MKRLNLRWPVLALSTALLLPSLPFGSRAAYAQSTSAGTITGTVTDPSGAVVPGAVITVTDPATKTRRTTTTNAQGLFVLPNVAPGTYDVTTTKAGFQMDEIPALTVAVGAQTTANFKMSLGSENTTVTVEASNADLQTMNASTSQTVDPAVVDSLPAINRDASQFASFQPGVTPGGSVAGTVSDQAVFDLDGGNNSSDMDGSMQSYTGSFGNSTTGGSIGASSSGVMPMPQDSVEEVRVSTTGQTADFNNSTGMQASVVTKRGHDQWHGTVYEYYLDSNIGANTWQNNFPTGYTKKPSYHYSRFGVAGGGPIAPYLLGGKTYLFANYEGFRYPLAATFERSVPSAAFMAGNLTFNGTTYTANQLQQADPRGLGFNPTLKAFYAKFLPQQGASGLVGSFDTSCSLVSSLYCDGVNTIGYRANVLEAQSSNFFVARIDHDFGAKWHAMASYRYYKLTNQTGNQIDIGGAFSGDTLGTPAAVAPRPQDPWYLVLGLTTNISSTLTNDVHYSYLRNYWQWKNDGDFPQTTGWGGVIEPLGEGGSVAGTMVPYNVNAQSTRTRIWDGKDNFLRDDITKLKGDHLIQAGGQYQHNFNYHQRTDNGNAINYSTTYQIGDASGGGLISYSGLGATLPTGNSVSGRVIDSYYGFVTDTQAANTYTNTSGKLSLNPAYTPFFAHTTIPYYNLYATDTWHLSSSLTLNYGLSYAIEMPPTERDGNQVLFTDANGTPYQTQKFLANRAAQAMIGNVFNSASTNATNGINPEVGFTLVHNAVNGPSGSKYPYNPFYAALSPRLSAAWSPNFKNPALKKIFGNNATVIRGGYGRIYGRINGVIQVLNPILSPGLVLATQCRYVQNSLGTGACSNNGNLNDTTAFRFGTDGTTAPLAAAPTNLTTPVYHPGIDGPAVAIASPLDPTYRPNDVDTINFSIQRQVNRKMLVEVGYIGRLIHHELETLDPNAVPYMTTLNGQSFAAAYAAVEAAFGCTTSAGLCSATTTTATKNKIYPTVAPQPFFEAALGGPTSAYCSAYSSCTAAVVAKQASNFGNQKVFALWSALDNNVNGANGAGFVFNRTMMGTAINGVNGAAGQLGTGLSVGTAAGYGNYHGGYLSFKISDFHGITLQENLTFSKALGLDDSAQSSSGLIANDSYDLSKSYGVQSYNQKVIFNTFLVWQDPYYKSQAGIIGRVAGGWTLAPVLTAGTGQPLSCGTNSGGQAYGGADGSNFGNNEQCVFMSGYSGGYHTHRGVTGGKDPNGISVGTSVHSGGPDAAVNMFTDPVGVYNSVRPLILGLDNHGSGTGPISGLPYLNLDLSVKKNLVVYNKYSLELTGVFINAMNHMDFANPSLSIASVSSWGVTKSQGNNPRQIQVGVRANF